MSECVVRMEMPKENTACELNYYCYREWRCVITDKRCDHNKNGEFPSWCPIICSLPEGHGRLGDLDALCEGLVSNHPVVIHAKNAPTIVPAERGEHV